MAKYQLPAHIELLFQTTVEDMELEADALELARIDAETEFRFKQEKNLTPFHNNTTGSCYA